MKNKLNISINKLQKALQISGRKTKSNKLLKQSVIKLTKLKKIPEEVLILSLENVGPLFLIKTKKKGKKVLQIPSPIYSIEKRFSISSNWIIKNSSKHNSTFFLQNFVNELLDSSDNQGFSKKQQQELNKLVVLNRSSL
jgi:ribosomal protein S7